MIKFPVDVKEGTFLSFAIMAISGIVYTLSKYSQITSDIKGSLAVMAIFLTILLIYYWLVIVRKIWLAWFEKIW